ncbi:RICIN domain-containing protein [Streptomyces sp. NPDC048278]|uniref:RICIN domain-containing protein n=1 Tax=Streptomyces sp. NPDC048278 TaxID=3155809 RepID=UPI0034285591
MSGKNSPRQQPTTGETESGAAPDPTSGGAPATGAAREAQATAAAAAPAVGGEPATGPGGTETAARAEEALTARSRPAAAAPVAAPAPAPGQAAGTSPAPGADAGADVGAAPEREASAGPGPEAAPEGHADTEAEAAPGTGTGAGAGSGADTDVVAAPAFGRPSRGLLAGAAIAGALLIGVPFLVSGMLGRSGPDGKTSDRAAEAGTVLNGATTDAGPGAYGSATPDPVSSSPTASPSRPADGGRKNTVKKGAGAAAAGAGVVAGSSAEAPKKASSGGSSKKKTTGTKATVTATVTSAPGTTIYSHASNRCIEMVGHKGADGSPLEIWNCNGKNWQKWDFRSDGTIRSMGLCMDVAWGSSQNGAVIQLAVCSGNPAQQFRLNSSNDLVNPQANKCVDVKDEQTGNGTRLQLWDCNGQDNQKWSTR